jgi:hypothetical protein
MVSKGVFNIMGRGFLYHHCCCFCLVHPRTGLKQEDVAKRMAALTPGFAGADIANVCNEAGVHGYTCG